MKTNKQLSDITNKGSVNLIEKLKHRYLKNWTEVNLKKVVKLSYGSQIKYYYKIKSILLNIQYRNKYYTESTWRDRYCFMCTLMDLYKRQNIQFLGISDIWFIPTSNLFIVDLVRPGLLIGKSGKDIDTLTQKLSEMYKTNIRIAIIESRYSMFNIIASINSDY